MGFDASAFEIRPKPKVVAGHQKSQSKRGCVSWGAIWYPRGLGRCGKLYSKTAGRKCMPMAFRKGRQLPRANQHHGVKSGMYLGAENLSEVLGETD